MSGSADRPQRPRPCSKMHPSDSGVGRFFAVFVRQYVRFLRMKLGHFDRRVATARGRASEESIYSRTASSFALGTATAAATRMWPFFSRPSFRRPVCRRASRRVSGGWACQVNAPQDGSRLAEGSIESRALDNRGPAAVIIQARRLNKPRLLKQCYSSSRTTTDSSVPILGYRRSLA